MSDALTINNDDRLEAIAVEIETIQGVALLKIGERLLEAQQLFRHDRDEGGFTGWIEGRLSFSRRTAYKLIDVFKAFGAESVHIVHELPKQVLYALAEPDAPPSLRQKALAMVKPGEPVDSDAVADLKRELAEAKKAAKDAKRDEKMQKEVAAKANADRARLLRDYEWAKSNAETLAKEVERLKQDNVIHYYPKEEAQPASDASAEAEPALQDPPVAAPPLSQTTADPAGNIARIINDNLHADTAARIASWLEETTVAEVAAAIRAAAREDAA